MASKRDVLGECSSSWRDPLGGGLTAPERAEFSEKAHLAQQRYAYRGEFVEWLQLDEWAGGGLKYFFTGTFAQRGFRRVGISRQRNGDMESARSAVRKELPKRIDEIEQYRWEPHEYRVSCNRAGNCFGRVISHFNDEIHGGRVKKGLSTLFGVRVFERHKSGRVHVHALIGGVRCKERGTFLKMDRLRMCWNEWYGFSFVEPVHEYAAKYIAKYITKGFAEGKDASSAYRFFGKWPRVSRGRQVAG